MNTYEETPRLSWLQETDTEDENETTTSPLVGTETAWSEHATPTYDAITADSQSDETGEEENPPDPPRKNICLHVFGLFEMFAIVTCSRLLLMQLAPLVFLPLREIGILQVALRIDVSLCCALFVLNELEVPISFIQKSPMLQNYVSRGFIYSFVGLIGMEESYAVFVSELKHEKSYQLNEFHVAWETLFIKGASLVMVVMGFCYVVLGAFCMKRLREKLRARYHEALEEYEQELLRHEKKWGKKKPTEKNGPKRTIVEWIKWGKATTTTVEHGEKNKAEWSKWDKTFVQNGSNTEWV